MPMNWTKPVETNRPKDETPRRCFELLNNAKSVIAMSNCSSSIDKNKRMQAILDLREHQEHMGMKISPLSEFNVTQQKLDEWLISDPKRTAKMLHSALVTTINLEVRYATLEIKQKYRKKLDEYRGNNKGSKPTVNMANNK